MSLSNDSLSADGNDYVNSACREKKKPHLLKRHEMSKWSFDDGNVVTDWNTVHYHIAFY